MRKHWVALLSLLGLAGSTVPVDAQVLKGDQAKPATKPAAKPASTKPANAATTNQKLQVKQQPLRQQNQAAGAAGQTKAGQNTGTCVQKNKAALTPPPPGQATRNNAITKGNNTQLTKGNQGKAALTPPPPGQANRNNAITKGNNNTQLTKANNTQLTKANNTAVTKAKN
jgi:hypothetical protein